MLISDLMKRRKVFKIFTNLTVGIAGVRIFAPNQVRSEEALSPNSVKIAQATMSKDLAEVIKQAALTNISGEESEESLVITVADSQIISFDGQTALLFVTFNQGVINSSLQSTRTIGIKTSDGGETWVQTLDARGGSLVFDEIFLLDENHIWVITQWQVAGTYPTLYWTDNFGETWQKSEAVNDFPEFSTIRIAKDIRFKDSQNGVIIIFDNRGDETSNTYLLQTNDSGKTWKEIEVVPKWYFSNQSLNWKERTSAYWKLEKGSQNFTLLKPNNRFSTKFYS